MLIYIVVFAISLLFTNKACNSKVWLNHLLAIALPVLLLTFRDHSVGTDTEHYIDSFNQCGASDSLLFFIISSRYEIGFSSITYYIYHLGMGVNAAFFIYALLTIVPVYIGAMCIKDKASPIIVMALFYLMFYHYSFNIVRQSIAMSFVFLSIVQMLKGNDRIAVALWIFAVLNHNSAIINIVFLVLIKLRSRNILAISFVLAFLFVAIVLVVKLFFVEQLEYYEDYLDRGQSRAEKSYIIEMFLNFLIVLYAKRKCVENSSFFLFASLTTLLLIIVSPIAPFFFRIANVCDFLLLIYIPQIINAASKPFLKRFYLSFAIFYWWFVFIYNNSGDSYPYIINL